jgi:hypothetical protein
MRNNRETFGSGADFHRNSHHRTEPMGKMSEVPTPFSGASLHHEKVKVVKQ